MHYCEEEVEKEEEKKRKAEARDRKVANYLKTRFCCSRLRFFKKSKRKNKLGDN